MVRHNQIEEKGWEEEVVGEGVVVREGRKKKNLDVGKNSRFSKLEKLRYG